MSEPAAAPYQLFDPLTAEEYAALKADIQKRGIQIPVEKDESGNTLDGHHREQIAAELGIKCPTVTRRFKSEQENREHVIKINLARRHLDPIRWGQALIRLMEERGIESGRGKNQIVKQKLSEPRSESSCQTMGELAAELGVHPRTARKRVAQAKQYEALPAKVKKAVVAGKKTPQRAIKEAKAATARASAISPVAGDDVETQVAASLEALVKRGMKFGTIYVDPPWRYGNTATRAHVGGEDSNHYDTMSLDDIAALPVGQLAAEKSHLWLWTTNAFLFECPRLFAAWGFEFKSSYVWVKRQMGIGNYLRNSHEFLLLAVHGGLVGQAKDVKSWGEFDRGEHSAKPERIRADVVEKLSPGPRLELFARKEVPHWTVWGNQVAPDKGLFAEQAEHIAEDAA